MKIFSAQILYSVWYQTPAWNFQGRKDSVPVVVMKTVALKTLLWFFPACLIKVDRLGRYRLSARVTCEKKCEAICARLFDSSTLRLRPDHGSITQTRLANRPHIAILVAKISVLYMILGKWNSGYLWNIDKVIFLSNGFHLSVNLYLTFQVPSQKE